MRPSRSKLNRRIAVPVGKVSITSGGYGPSARVPSVGDYSAGRARDLSNTGMTSGDTVHADVTGTKFWQDTANNLVWVRVRNNLTDAGLKRVVLCVNA